MTDNLLEQLRVHRAVYITVSAPAAVDPDAFGFRVRALADLLVDMPTTDLRVHGLIYLPSNGSPPHSHLVLHGNRLPRLKTLRRDLLPHVGLTISGDPSRAVRLVGSTEADRRALTRYLANHLRDRGNMVEEVRR